MQKLMLIFAAASLAADLALTRSCQTALALASGFQMVNFVLADAVWPDVAKLRARP
jgi:hypothetical protein